MKSIHAMKFKYTKIGGIPCIVSQFENYPRNMPEGINGLKSYFLKHNAYQIEELQKAKKENAIFGHAIYAKENLEGTKIHLDDWGYPMLEFYYCDGREKTKIKTLMYPEINKKYRKRVANVKAFELNGIEYTYQEAREMGYESCDCCGEWHMENEIIDTDNGDRICEKCKDEYYFYCEDCGALEPWDEAVPIHTRYGEMYVCETCSDKYECCMDCGEKYIDELMEKDSQGNWLCNKCQNYYFVCQDCGCWISENDAYTGNDNNYYCENCIDDHKSLLHDYGYKPKPNFLSTGDEEPDTKFYMGVELEIDDGDNVCEAVNDLGNAGGNRIYMKHDGSLGDKGIEIVTHPATLNYHMSRFPWMEIIEAAKRNGYSSHDAGTCGLHIHIGRQELGTTDSERDDTIRKVIILVERYWDEIVNFSRRKESQILDWAKRPDIHDWFSGFHCVSTYRETIDVRCGSTRYTAVNVKNYNTIEFRIFRGTLNYTTLIATLQFVQTLVEYAKFNSYEAVETISFRKMFAFTQYCELKRYLEKRNLIGEGESYDEDETLPTQMFNVAAMAMAV